MKLSPTMEAAIAAARENDGVLRRFSGGNWQGAESFDPNRTRLALGTIRALVERGLAVYTAFQSTQTGCFWTACKLVESFDEQEGVGE